MVLVQSVGSEASLWTTVSKNMKGEWEIQRVENSVGPGTPDVYYTMNSGTMGWLENKHAHEWPKRPSTALRLDHFTPQQRSFLRRHGKLKANVWILLQVESDYFLLDYQEAQNIGGEYWDKKFSEKPWTKQDYLDNCSYHWYPRINYQELIFVLS